MMSPLKRSIFPALFGLAALIALFFKLPGVLELFGQAACKNCQGASPYLLMIASAYFATFIALLLVFPAFFTPSIALGGLLWSIGLAAALMLQAQEFCGPCLLSHVLHIAAWTILWLYPYHKSEEDKSLLGLKLTAVFLAPLTVMALFSTLHTTFLIYGLLKEDPLSSLVKVGEVVKPFAGGRLEGYKGAVVTFVASSCVHCKTLLPQLEALAIEYKDKGLLFMTLGRTLPADLKELAPHLEWTEDKEGSHFPVFGVTGFPTTILLDSQGRVVQVTAGVPEDFVLKLKAAFAPILDQPD